MPEATKSKNTVSAFMTITLAYRIYITININATHIDKAITCSSQEP